jgi:hypothetical protein
MKIKSIICALILSANIPAFAYDNGDNQINNAQYIFEFAGDTNHQTAFTGADWTMSIIEGYRVLDDKIAAGIDSPLMNALMMIPRIVMTGYATTFHHEVFGHGARVRGIGQGWKVRSYKFDIDGSGLTSYRFNPNSPSQYTPAVTVAGMQATEVLGNKIKDRMIDSEKINPVYGAAYLMSAGDQIVYTYLTEYEGKGHDVKSYIEEMNDIYGKNYLSKRKIKSRTAISLLDPFLYFSAYALATGEDFEFPMISLGDWKYLPAFRSIWTPYGTENKWLNLFKTPSTPMQLNLWSGKNKSGSSWGGEAIVDRIYGHENIDVGFNIAAWQQPKMFLAKPLNAPKKRGYSAEGNVKLNLQETSAIYASIGYKSNGFRVGYPMNSGMLFRMGLAFKF